MATVEPCDYCGGNPNKCLHKSSSPFHDSHPAPFIYVVSAEQAIDAIQRGYRGYMAISDVIPLRDETPQ